MTGSNVSPSAKTILALGVALGLGGAVALSSLYAPRGIAAAIAVLMMGACFVVVVRCALDITSHEQDDDLPDLIARTVADAMGPWYRSVLNILPAPEELSTAWRGHELRQDHEGRLFTCHPEAKCEGEGCPIHHPSNHPMRELPWHAVNRPLITRLCPHGYQHPDPDSLAYVLRHVDPRNEYRWQMHECCPQGCCGAVRQTSGDHPSVDDPIEEEPVSVPTVVRENLATAADTARALTRQKGASVVPLYDAT